MKQEDYNYFDFVTMSDKDLEAADQMFEDLRNGTFYENQTFQGHPPKFLTTCKMCGMTTTMLDRENTCHSCKEATQ